MSQTVDALPDIIAGLTNRGYSLVTVPELLSYDAGSADGYLEYTVKNGDTLWSISQRFSATVDTLIKLNDLR